MIGPCPSDEEEYEGWCEEADRLTDEDIERRLFGDEE
jgi:hypothetical protein